MRYKFNKPTLLRKMAEYGQTIEQKVAYLQHTIAVQTSKEHFKVFNSLAHGYNLYYMLLNEAFELIRFKYSDYLVIVQKDTHYITIEIRKLGNAS